MRIDAGPERIEVLAVHCIGALYEDTDRYSWTRTYGDPAFYEWLLNQRRERPKY